MRLEPNPRYYKKEMQSESRQKGGRRQTGIKQLVIGDKWFATIQAAVTGEVQRLTRNLTERVQELEERYAQLLSELEHEIQFLAKKLMHIC